MPPLRCSKGSTNKNLHEDGCFTIEHSMAPNCMFNFSALHDQSLRYKTWIVVEDSLHDWLKSIS